ncbi:MAG: hypothetical protein JXB32_17075 [Deltaproteobacteria bacterium]|nr:hypothetical protein [Deltaproteobacteria bacterium]
MTVGCFGRALGALLCLLALTGTRPAGAGEARLDALAGSPIVEDDGDIFDYPGLVTRYGDAAFLTVQPSPASGNAGVLVGRETAFGFWVHRTPRFDDLTEADALFGGFDLSEVHPLFDLLFGTDAGFGLRLSLSAGLDVADVYSGVEDDLLSTGDTSVGIDLQAGYSFDLGGAHPYHGDFGVGLTLSYFEVVELGQTTYLTGWIPSFLVRHRSVFDPAADVSWVLDVMLTRRAYTVEAEGATSVDGSFGRWMTYAAAGPRVRLPADVTLWLAGRVSLEQLGGEIDDDAQTSLLGVGFPGLVASIEVLLWELLTVRAGIDYDVYITQSESPGDDPRLAEHGLGHRFAWSTGLGLSLGRFQIDGTVSQRFYFNGPQVLGGNDPGFLGLISAAYAW